jgi:putative tricarboxylic transport membrane protein
MKGRIEELAMTRFTRISRTLMALSVALVATQVAAAGWEPDKAECIAPANPGGGWDTTCRTTAAILQKTGLLKKSMYVTNMPGGSGAVAIANVIARRKGDGTVVVAASNALTASMALKRTPSTYDDVIPLAMIGREYSGIFVRTDSPLRTLADLVAALKKDPGSVTFGGGSSPGGQDHI